MKLLEGKVALVTGATRGIGRAIAEEFARQGATVAFTYRASAEKARELEEAIAAQGVGCASYQADATDFAATQALMDDIVAKFGKIDVIVNNAGITADTLLLRMSEDQWNQVIQTNLNSIFYTTKASLKHMMRKGGSVINISSVVGLQGNAGQANYAASKAGMIGFTKSLAREMGSRGIRANVVAPGFIATEMTHKLPEKELQAWLENIPLKRAGTPKDVANLCVFLASDMSSYVTGQVYNVDGGMVMA
ncbi:MAG: 3-oxoacyl-[acyl-carrier-protein] reductase [Bacteroidetes bacterium]|nr:MAG: 3-oxoacyl-[acyl-carrier-protein] reductase [Bacteroidota bacterium]